MEIKYFGQFICGYCGVRDILKLVSYRNDDGSLGLHNLCFDCLKVLVKEYEEEQKEWEKQRPERERLERKKKREKVIQNLLAIPKFVGIMLLVLMCYVVVCWNPIYFILGCVGLMLLGLLSGLLCIGIDWLWKKVR